MKEGIDQLYRDNYGKLVSSLVSYFGLTNLALAEDIVQEAFLKAMAHWEKEYPNDPKAWLFKTCKNTALNHFNKKANAVSHRSLYESDATGESYKLDQLLLPDEIQDNQLRLLFACCHPDLPAKSQVILTLRVLAGFKTEEIASGLDSHVETVKKTLSRTRKKIKASGLQLRVPFLLQSKKRLKNVHKVIYLLFNEGYQATTGERQIRSDLCFEAIRLIKMLIDQEKIHDSSSYALFSLMLFNMARFTAREEEDGSIIDLEWQNRKAWDQELLAAGFYYLKKARQDKLLTSYHLEAGIAAIHCSADSFAKTDWCTILKFYKLIYDMNPSPIVLMNQCIALGYCMGFQQAIDILKTTELKNALQLNHLYHVTLGKFHTKLDNTNIAKAHFLKGLQLTKVANEKRYINELVVQLEESLK